MSKHRSDVVASVEKRAASIAGRVDDERLRESVSHALELTKKAAERAAHAAHEARHSAEPHVRHAAKSAFETLGARALHTASLLAEASERVVEASPLPALLALDASELKPTPKRHRMRTLILGMLAVAGIVAFFRSSMPSRIMDKLSRQRVDEEVDTVVLPIDSDELRSMEHDNDHEADAHGHAVTAKKTVESETR